MFKKLITVGLLAGALVGIPSAAQAAQATQVRPDAATCSAFHSWEHTGSKHDWDAMIHYSTHADTFLRLDVSGLVRHHDSQHVRFVRTDCSTLSGYGL